MAQKIGILTGGGDCPGLNAVIYSLVKTGCTLGIECIGFKKGFDGLIGEISYLPLTLESVQGLAQTGGTVLKSTNKGTFTAKVGGGAVQEIDPAILEEAKSTVEKLGIDCLVAIGGDGSMSIALQLQKIGINVVGIPKTIDNDLNSTDQTFGFSSAVELIYESLARIHTTAVSHDRVFFVETMGRNVGWLTLYGGIAGGADMILIPEFPFTYEKVLEFLRMRRDKGKKYAVVLVAEGASAVGASQVAEKNSELSENHLGGIAAKLAYEINYMAPDEFEIRTLALGHLQRGGLPNAEDVILAERFGFGAIKAIQEEKFGHMVSLRGKDIVTIPIEQAVQNLKSVEKDSDIVLMAKNLGISFGD